MSNAMPHRQKHHHLHLNFHLVDLRNFHIHHCEESDLRHRHHPVIFRLVMAEGIAATGIFGALAVPAYATTASQDAWGAICVPAAQLVGGSGSAAYPPPLPKVNSDLSINWDGSDPNAFAQPTWEFPTPPTLAADGQYVLPQAYPFGTVIGEDQKLETFQLNSYAVSPFDNAHGTGAVQPGVSGPTTPVPDLVDGASPFAKAGGPSATAKWPSIGTDVVGGVAQKVAESPLRVNVLLPPGYDPSGKTRYPVVYLLTGSLDNSGYSSILWHGGAAASSLAAAQSGHPVIEVMPDTSESGNDFDWYGLTSSYTASSEVPDWETFFTKELVPFIDRNFPTIDSASGRAIAGISAAGRAALLYAEDNPGMFGQVASLSGLADEQATGLLGGFTWPQLDGIIDGATVNSWPVSAEGPSPACALGDPYSTDPAPVSPNYWNLEDPAVLADNLAGTDLFLVSGDGVNVADSAEFDPTESIVGTMTYDFASVLFNQGIAGVSRNQDSAPFDYDQGFGSVAPPTPGTNDCSPSADICIDVYPAGHHSFAYWTDDIGSLIDWLGSKQDPTTTAQTTTSEAGLPFTSTNQVSSTSEVPETSTTETSGVATTEGEGSDSSLTPSSLAGSTAAPSTWQLASAAEQVTGWGWAFNVTPGPDETDFPLLTVKAQTDTDVASSPGQLQESHLQLSWGGSQQAEVTFSTPTAPLGAAISNGATPPSSESILSATEHSSPNYSQSPDGPATTTTTPAPTTSTSAGESHPWYFVSTSVPESTAGVSVAQTGTQWQCEEESEGGGLRGSVTVPGSGSGSGSGSGTVDVSIIGPLYTPYCS